MYSKFEILLAKKGITAYAVAKATGIDNATLSNWKHGNYTPKLDKLMTLARYFGVDVSYFIEGGGKDDGSQGD